MILTLEHEVVCYLEVQSSQSLGYTPSWSYEQRAQASFDNRSSTQWEAPPVRNTGLAGLDNVFEVLLQTDWIKSRSPCREWKTYHGTKEI